jgi:large subunit ribosomal protein L3
MKGILGRKVGMTQVFTAAGVLIPVTVIEVEPNIVTQIKTKETDGYEAIQLGFSTKREKLSNKPEQGHVKKANTTPKRFLREIRGVNLENYQLGQEIKVDIFEEGESVDVTGISKGKGFQGVIKRHNFARGPMGHGSHHHRLPGSIGDVHAARVFKGKKMPGHMGNETVTIQNLEVISVDVENNLILIKGNVPGPKKSMVIIKKAVKAGDIKKEIKELISYEETASINEEVETEVIEEKSDEETDVKEESESTTEVEVEETVSTEEEKQESSQEDTE